jgi:DNA mismatch repair ATPase MutL
VFVDGRPVNADRDLLKELLKTYKRHIRCAFSSDKSSNLTKPFICLHISCPPESYDVNVEPAKDRVLFYKPNVITTLFNQLLQDLYGDLAVANPTQHVDVRAQSSTDPDAFSVMLSRNSHSTTTPSTNSSTDRPDVTAASKTSEMAGKSTTEKSSPDTERAFGENSSTDNPWIKAKVNIRLRPPGLTSKFMGDNDISLDRNNVENSLATPHRTPLEPQVQLLTPESVCAAQPYQNPGPPPQRRAARDPTSSTDFSAAETPTQPSLLQSWIQSQEQALDQAESLMPPPSTLQNDHAGTSTVLTPDPSQANKDLACKRRSINSGTRQQKPFISPFKRPTLSQFPDEDNTQHTHTHAPTHARTQVQGRATSPDVSNQELEWILDFERQKKALNHRKRAMKTSRDRQAMLEEFESTSGSQIVPSNSDVHSRVRSESPAPNFAQQFNQELDQPIARRKIPTRASHEHGDTEALPSRPRNGSANTERLSDAPHPLQPQEGTINPLKIPESDARAVLIQEHQRRDEEKLSASTGLTRTGLKVRRVKTTRLPLETIPAGKDLYNLALNLDLDAANGDAEVAAQKLAEQTQYLDSIDEYMRHGTIQTATFGLTMSDIEIMSKVLHRLVQQQYQPTTMTKSKEDAEQTSSFVFEIDLRRALKAHIDEYGT